MMKKLIVIVATLIAILALLVPAFAGEVKQVSSTQARSLLAQKPGPFLLDVRSDKEYRQGRIRGAVLIPITQLPRRVAEVPRDREVLVYCAVGGRSRIAAALLSAKGYRGVYNMTDGIAGWEKNGYPVEK